MFHLQHFTYNSFVSCELFGEKISLIVIISALSSSKSRQICLGQNNTQRSTAHLASAVMISANGLRQKASRIWLVFDGQFLWRRSEMFP